MALGTSLRSSGKCCGRGIGRGGCLMSIKKQQSPLLNCGTPQNATLGPKHSTAPNPKALQSKTRGASEAAVFSGRVLRFFASLCSLSSQHLEVQKRVWSCQKTPWHGFKPTSRSSLGIVTTLLESFSKASLGVKTGFRHLRMARLP